MNSKNKVLKVVATIVAISITIGSLLMLFGANIKFNLFNIGFCITSYMSLMAIIWGAWYDIISEK